MESNILMRASIELDVPTDNGKRYKAVAENAKKLCCCQWCDWLLGLQIRYFIFSMR